jgi:hypothetical protein
MDMLFHLISVLLIFLLISEQQRVVPKVLLDHRQAWMARHP